MTDQRRRIAGANEYRTSDDVKISCTTDKYNEKVEYITVKRASEAHGARNNQSYKMDASLMRRLRAWAEEHGYPLVGPTTNRVPVRLTAVALDDVFQARRECRISVPLFCQCAVWREKTEQEALADGLLWPPEESDDEAYVIGEATRYTYDEIPREVKRRNGETFRWTDYRQSGAQKVVCNPATCPYATGEHGIAKRVGAICKPRVLINFTLGDWAGDAEGAFIESTAWSTVRRFPSTLADLLRETGGNLVDVQIDLVLRYTKPVKTPSGARERQPYWTLARPHEMTREEFRAAAIAETETLLAQTTRLAELAARRNAAAQLWGRPDHELAYLSEFVPEVLSLPENGLEADADEPCGWTVLQTLAYKHLTAHGMSPIAAQAEVDQGDEHIAAKYPELTGTTTQPMDGILEGEYEADVDPVEEVPPTDRTPEPEPEPDPEPEPEPEPSQQPGFTEPLITPPTTPGEILQMLQVLAVPQDIVDALVSNAWEAVTNKPRTVTPGPGTCANPDEYANVTRALMQGVNRWYAQEGYKSYPPCDQCETPGDAPEPTLDFGDDF